VKTEVDKLIQDYTKWLAEKTIGKPIDDIWTKISTPFLDRHNDGIEIYIKKEGSGYFLTDDGSTIRDLEMSGCELKTQKRKDLLETALAGFGATLHDEEITIKADKSSFPLKKHSLVQAILAVNDLFYLATPYVKQLFYEDVLSWLDLNDIRYSSNFKLSGKSGFDHNFDFLIPKSKNAPERIVQTMNTPKKENAENLVFRWQDTKEARKNEVVLFAILNDTDNQIQKGVSKIFTAYGIETVKWSERQNFLEQLSA
jgi:hypothetical protein